MPIDRVKAVANMLFDSYDWGALEVANKTWQKYRETDKHHAALYEEVWWYILDQMPGDELAKRFSTDQLAQIAVARSLKKIESKVS